MGSLETKRTIVGWAARDPSGILSPHTFTLKNTGSDDVYVKVHYCGVCHSDLHQIKNDLGMSNYSMVRGHEVVSEVLEVGSNVSKFKVEDRVGAGLIVGCCENCRACQSNIEQYCNKKIWSYNDVYIDGRPTQGGFAETMVVERKFVLKIPEGLAPEQAAPLLCVGVTVYSPLSHFGLKESGLRGGILGLGGVGHMGVKIVKALGHHVTMISSSDRKKEEAFEHLRAVEYLVSSDAERMKEAADSLDYIIDTVPVGHPLEPYLSLLKAHGKLILMGVINTPLQFVSPMVMLDQLETLDITSEDAQKIYENNLVLRAHRRHLDFRYGQYRRLREEIDKHEGGLDAFSRDHENLASRCSATGITYREWTLRAKSASLIGDFNNWNPHVDVMVQLGSYQKMKRRIIYFQGMCRGTSQR